MSGGGVIAESEPVPELADVRHSRIHDDSRDRKLRPRRRTSRCGTSWARWTALRGELRSGGSRLATATQVHGADVRRLIAVTGRAGSAPAMPTGTSPPSEGPRWR